MRPINLIPKEERRGARTPMRGGPLAYIVVGALIAALAGIMMLVTTDNQISDSKAEFAELKAEAATAEATAKKLASYTSFAEIHEQRLTTVSNLANSRFDWEKVMRQLALVLPSNVWITSLKGTVSPEAEGSGGTQLRSSISGPALEMSGCATGQEAVADFISALKEIDGVTRVGVQSSAVGGASGESSGGRVNSAESSVSAGGTCEGSSKAQFQLVVAFDAAPIPETGTGESAEVTAPPAESSPSGESETQAASESSSSETSSEGG